MDKITKLPWFATKDFHAGDERENVWTISPDPNETGWETDSGYPGYGLSKADAEYICRAVNSHEGLVNAAKLWLQHLESHISDLEPGYDEIIALQKLIKAADGDGVK